MQSEKLAYIRFVFLDDFGGRTGGGDIIDMIRFCDREVYEIEYCK